MNPSWLKTYREVIEPWKLHLALSRMKALRIRGQDWQDMMQELALPLIEFRYDPATANGAAEETVLCTVVNDCLRQIIRAQTRDRERVVNRARRQGITGQPERDERYTVYEVPFGLHMDVGQVLEEMSPFERPVCEGIMNGLSFREIARMLDCHHTTVSKAAKSIREKFQDAGLDGWVV